MSQAQFGQNINKQGVKSIQLDAFHNMNSAEESLHKPQYLHLTTCIQQYDWLYPR